MGTSWGSNSLEVSGYHKMCPKSPWHTHLCTQFMLQHSKQHSQDFYRRKPLLLRKCLIFIDHDPCPNLVHSSPGLVRHGFAPCCTKFSTMLSTENRDKYANRFQFNGLHGFPAVALEMAGPCLLSHSGATPGSGNPCFRSRPPAQSHPPATPQARRQRAVGPYPHAVRAWHAGGRGADRRAGPAPSG